MLVLILFITILSFVLSVVSIKSALKYGLKNIKKFSVEKDKKIYISSLIYLITGILSTLLIIILIYFSCISMIAGPISTFLINYALFFPILGIPCSLIAGIIGILINKEFYKIASYSDLPIKPVLNKIAFINSGLLILILLIAWSIYWSF